MPDTKLKEFFDLTLSRQQLEILQEIFDMKGLGFTADQGIAVGTLREKVTELLAE